MKIIVTQFQIDKPISTYNVYVDPLTTKESDVIETTIAWIKVNGWKSNKQIQPLTMNLYLPKCGDWNYCLENRCHAYIS